MRTFALSLLALALAACATTGREPASSVEIKQILPRYMAADQFVRIKEYLGAQEHLGGRCVIRSRPGERAGFYFVLVLDTSVKRLPPGTEVLAEVAGPTAFGPVEYTLTVPERRPGTRELFIGLTGEDWPDPDAVPSAWRFTLRDANGNTLGSRHNYLWSL